MVLTRSLVEPVRKYRRGHGDWSRSGAAAHLIHQAADGDSSLEERIAVALDIDGIGKVAQHFFDLLLGITDPAQQPFDLVVRNKSFLHQRNATPLLV